MAIVTTDDRHYRASADALRNKLGTTQQYRPADMAAAISSIPTGGGGSDEWTYPAEWPPEPEMPDVQRCYALYKIYRDAPDTAFYITTASTSALARIDWGDGIVEMSRQLVSHTYDFDALDAPILADGAKTVYVTIDGGNIQKLQFTRMNSKCLNTLVFIKCNCSGFKQMNGMFGTGVVGLALPLMLEAAIFSSIPQLISYADFCYGCMGLRKLDFGEVLKPTNLSGFAVACINLKIDFVINPAGLAGSSNGMSYATFGVYNSGIKSFKLVGGSTLHTYANSNPFLSSNMNARVIDISECNMVPISTATTFTPVGDVSCPVEEIRFRLDSINVATYKLDISKMLKKVVMLGTMGSTVATINLAGTRIESDVLDHILEKLSDRTELAAGKLNIQYTPAASTWTPEQAAIAAAKNWTVTGV